jgi:hypothetical protein
MGGRKQLDSKVMAENGGSIGNSRCSHAGGWAGADTEKHDD